MISSATIAELYSTYIKGHRISTDSRNILKDDVFIALRGENFNGNKFSAGALEAGASSVFIDDPECKCSERCIVVPDTLLFLQAVASHHRKQLNIPIIGITGTNGKTTTKELCHAVLSSKYTVSATKGNLNNHIGVPLTLLAMDDATRIGIVEMGANHPGEIKALCAMADPDYGIITNIGQAHLEGFGSYEQIVCTKKELYDHVAAKGGTLFVHAEDELLMQLSGNARRVTYGINGDFTKGEIKQRIPYLVYALKTRKGDLYVKTHLTGGYNFANAMAAACVGSYFEVGAEEAGRAIEEYRPSNMRSQLIETGSNIVIMDAYNANPSSMKAALDNFADFKNGHKVVILGEMLELGRDSEKFHQEIREIALGYGFSQIMLVGRHFSPVAGGGNIRHFDHTEELIAHLKGSPLNGAYIFVKGSRGNGLERIVEYL